MSTKAGNQNDTPASGSETKLIAQLRAGEEKLGAEVSSRGDSLQLHVGRSRQMSEPGVRVDDLQVTLFLKDGRTVQPPLVSPGQKWLVGAVSHHSTYESAAYNLTGIALGELTAVQVVFRKQPSERTPFHAP